MLNSKEIDIEGIINSARHFYAAADDNDSDLAEYVSGQAVKYAFNAYFDKFFPSFPSNIEKPEVLSCHGEDGGPIIDGAVVICDIDISNFKDESALYPLMNAAELWVSNNFGMLMSLVVEKNDLEVLITQGLSEPFRL
jgi:hypothetical protein